MKLFFYKSFLLICFFDLHRFHIFFESFVLKRRRSTLLFHKGFLSLPGQQEVRCPRQVSMTTETAPHSLAPAAFSAAQGPTGSAWPSPHACFVALNSETTSGIKTGAGRPATRRRSEARFGHAHGQEERASGIRSSCRDGGPAEYSQETVPCLKAGPAASRFSRLIRRLESGEAS